MKNMRVWLGSFLILVILLLVGCTRHPRFETIETNTLQEAFDGISNLSHSIKYFAAKPEFQLSGGFGKIRLKGDIEYSTTDGWNINLNGPLGIEMAHISTSEDSIRIKTHYNGAVFEKRINEELDFSELGLELPDISVITNMLLPVLTLQDDENWEIAGGTPGQPGSLLLVRGADASNDSLSITLDYNPLRVRSYQFRYDSQESITRSFEYGINKRSLPIRSVITAGDFMLEITYYSMELDLFPSRGKDSAI